MLLAIAPVKPGPSPQLETAPGDILSIYLQSAGPGRSRPIMSRKLTTTRESSRSPVHLREPLFNPRSRELGARYFNEAVHVPRRRDLASPEGCAPALSHCSLRINSGCVPHLCKVPDRAALPLTITVSRTPSMERRVAPQPSAPRRVFHPGAAGLKICCSYAVLKMAGTPASRH